MHLRDLWIKICITLGVLSILVEPTVASQCLGVTGTSRHTRLSPLLLDNVNPLLEKPLSAITFTADSVLCLIFQTTGKFLLPSSRKPNVKNKFIFTLLVTGTILQLLFETTGVQEYS